MPRTLGIVKHLNSLRPRLYDARRINSRSQIARRVGLTRQSVRRTVDLLEAEKVVERVPNPDHRAAELVRLTSRGTPACAAIARRQVN
jgi:DNA-binding MarR family transcriptional regulator